MHHHRHSRLVVVLKVVLPAVAVVLLALIVLWPQMMNRSDDRFSIGYANLSPQEVQALSMVNARYFGIDESNHPFTVTADLALEDNAQDGIITLEQPKADFTTKSGANVYVEARQGFYHQKEQLLDLKGDVNLFHDSGYELHTQSAQIDFVHSSAQGDAPVTGQGPQGRLAGQGFEIRDSGKQVMVTGTSLMTLQGVKRK